MPIPNAYTPTVTPSVEALLGDPAVSYWLKNALKAALERDCLDSARDAGTLAAVLAQRCDDVLQVPARQNLIADQLEQVRRWLDAGNIDMARLHVDNALEMVVK